MKNIKTLLILATLILSVPMGYAQKIKIKDKMAYVDDKPYLKVSDCGAYEEDCSISNLEGKEIISIDKLKDISRGSGTFFRVTFKGLNTTIEIRNTMWGLVELLFKNNVVKPDGQLDPENVKILSKRYGNNISLKDSEEE